MSGTTPTKNASGSKAAGRHHREGLEGGGGRVEVVALVAVGLVLVVAVVTLAVVPVVVVCATGAGKVPTVVAIVRADVRKGSIAIEDVNASRSRRQKGSRNGGPNTKRVRNCRRRPQAGQPAQARRSPERKNLDRGRVVGPVGRQLHEEGHGRVGGVRFGFAVRRLLQEPAAARATRAKIWGGGCRRKPPVRTPSRGL